MYGLAGKKLGVVDFVERDGALYGRVAGTGFTTEYEIRPVEPKFPPEAIFMDLDGTTVKSEEFWIYIIERTVQTLMNDTSFRFVPEDIPFVSGFGTVEHLGYCIEKYAHGAKMNHAIEIYHKIARYELNEIREGRGHVEAFHPAEGLKDFLYAVKAAGIKIGLVTGGLDYKAIPEIEAVFRTLDMGDPLKFYDAVLLGGREKGKGEYGTLGELVTKPHPWVYTEMAYMGLKISDPTRVIGIEDSAAGVLALRFAGFPAAGVNCGNIAASGLDCLCYKKVDRLQELLPVILNQ